jgi:hypothetical protein
MLKRLLLAVLLFPFVVPIHAEVNFPRIGGAAVHQCVKVVDGVDVAVGRASTLEKNAIADCLNAAGRDDPDAQYEVVVSYRIGISISGDARAQMFPFIPDVGEPDPGEPGAPPAGWAEVQIDGSVHALASSVLSYTDPIFTVGANGGEIYSTDDSFAAYYYTVPATGDFTLTAEIVTASQEVVLSKGGIMIRESLGSGSAHCMLAVFAHNGTLVDCRSATDGATSTAYFDGVDVTLPVCFRIERDDDIPSTKLLIKASAADCSTGTYTEVHQFFNAWTGYVLLATSPSQTGAIAKNATTTYDQVTVSTASVTHTPGDVGFNPTAYQISEESTPVTLTVSRTGDGNGACSLDYVVNDGSALAGTDYTDTSGTLSWTDSEIGDKTFNVTIIDRNGTAQGNKQFTAVLTKDTCASDNLDDATATVTILDQDAAGAAWTSMGVCDSILTGFCVHGADWDSFLDTDPDIEYRFITNRNTSGAGSFDAAVSNCTGNLRAVMPTISGWVTYAMNSFKGVSCSNLIVLMQVAPNPGMHMRGLKVTQSGANRQLWMHYSCFADSDVEALSACLQTGANNDSTDSVVNLNYGSVFNLDSGANIWKNADNVSYVQGMTIYPTDVPGSGENPEIYFFGYLDGSSQGATVARNVAAHFQGRCPKWEEMSGTFSNNVCYNGTNNWLQINNISEPGIVINLLDNLFISGANGVSGLPMRIPLSTDTISDPVTIARVGNRALGWDDSTQAGLTADNSGGDVTFVGTAISGAQATGYVSTPIGAGDAGERAFAVELACAQSGPRPSAGRLSVYQDICDQLANRYDSATPIGASIGPASDIGYPSVANNGPCDPFIEDSCGTGKPALPPESTVTVEQLLEYSRATHCAVSTAGSTGC